MLRTHRSPSTNRLATPGWRFRWCEARPDRPMTSEWESFSLCWLVPSLYCWIRPILFGVCSCSDHRFPSSGVRCMGRRRLMHGFNHLTGQGLALLSLYRHLEVGRSWVRVDLSQGLLTFSHGCWATRAEYLFQNLDASTLVRAAWPESIRRSSLLQLVSPGLRQLAGRRLRLWFRIRSCRRRRNPSGSWFQLH